MTRQEFLNQLSVQLYRLTPEERESALNYYREYLEEAGADEQAAIEALGSPQSVAERIIREIGTNRVTYGENPNQPYQYTAEDIAPAPASSGGGRLALTIIVMFFTLPLWLALFGLWVGLECTLGGILIGFSAAAVAAPIQGISELARGMQAEGLWDIGAGVTSLGLVLLLWKPIWLGIKHSALGLFHLVKACVLGLYGKEK